MGSFVLYILEWSLALLLLLLVWKIAFSGTTLHRFNRIYLIGATVASALLPLLNLHIGQTVPFSIEQTQFAYMLNEISVNGSISKIGANVSIQDYIWACILIAIYATYVFTLFVGWTRSFVRTRQFLKGRPYHKVGQSVRLYQAPGEFGPFSWMNCIVISSAENGFARRVSLRHELAHIRLGHYADLVFLLACTIVNPVCWLVLKEIKVIHEYEADAEVISRNDISDKDYQRLLIMRTVGAEAYAMASSFNLNIKQRIIMMKKEKTLKRRLLWLVLVIPAMGVSLTAFAKGNGVMAPGADEITVSKNDSVTTQNTVWVESVTPPDEVFTVVEDMPEFPGGMSELMKFIADNIAYPEEAEKQNITGRVVIQFVVDKDGSIIEPKVVKSVDPLLDAEALRVISKMPSWTPGKQRGETVRVKFTIPITFNLN